MFLLFLLFVLSCHSAHPECRYACDDPTCPAVCRHICLEPRCEIQCTNSTNAYCNPPNCRVNCPIVDQSESDSCPFCETVCDPPQCMPLNAECQPLCEATQCFWQCEKPRNCPKPRCELVCERPACEYSGSSGILKLSLGVLGLIFLI